MNIFLAVCFLFIFCHGPRHQPHRGAVAEPQATEQPTQPQANIGPQMQTTRGKACDQITKGFDSWGNQDDWVSEFPVAQQRRVLQCLSELAKKQGRE
jgi:hypothetical protein